MPPDDARLSSVVAHVPVVIWAVDRAGICVLSEGEGLSALGLRPGEAVGRGVAEMFPDQAEATSGFLARALAGESFAAELAVGSRWYRTQFAPHRDGGGAIVGMLAVSIDISERKHSEAVLAENEGRLRWLIDNTSDSIWRFALDRPVPIGLPVEEQIERAYRDAWLADCNAVTARMYGFASPRDMLGLRLDAMMPRAEPANVDYLRAFIASGYRLIDAESVERDRDGRPKAMLNNLIGIVEGDQLVGAWGATRDITERRAHEQELRANERQLALVTDALPALVSYIDVDRRYRLANQAYQEWFGHRREEMIGRTMAEVLGEEAYALIRPNLDLAFAGERQTFDRVIPYRDGGARHVRVDYMPDIDSSGTTRGVVALVQDVSAEKRREHREGLLVELSASLLASLDVDSTLARLARSIVPHLADWCAVHLPEGDTLREVAVEAADDRLRDAVIDIHRHWPVDDDYVPLQVLRSAKPIAVERIDEAMVRARLRDAAHADAVVALGLGSTVIAPLMGRSSALGVLTVATTGRRRLDAEDAEFLIDVARRAGMALENAQLYQAERAARELAATRAQELARSNAELEQFAYVSSHDLKEPLRMVTQYLGLLTRRHGADLPESARGWVRYAVDGAERAQRLIDDLLSFSRAGRGGEGEEAVDLGAVLREVETTMRGELAACGAELVVGPLPTLRFQRVKLLQVFQNLVGNALKFRATGRQARIEVSAERGASTWTLTVRDNGIGIDPAYHGRIFELFQRLHHADAYAGTGIGLAICKKIAESHGGRMRVESRPDEGAAFHLELPAALEVAPRG